MALTARQQRLYDVARATLPSWFFLDPDNAQEQLRAAAVMLSSSWDQVDFWIDQAFLLRAVDIFVDQHAKDRGTRRQDGESTAALVKRLRNIEDSVTPPALLQHVKDVLQASGGPSSPDPQIVELRRDKVYFGRRVHITPTTGALINDGETFTLGIVVFEFDKNSSVSGGHVAVPITDDYTAHEVALAIWQAIRDQDAAVGMDIDDQLYVPGVTTYSETVVHASFKMQIESLAYWNRGFRWGRDGIPEMIVVLPYGTPDGAAAAVVEAMRQYKAAGVNVTVETRLVP